MIDRSNRAELLGALNPALRVPTLVLDDDRVLAESNAILWYLALGTPYVPTDPFARRQVLQWMFFEQYSHEPNIAVARFWLFVKGAAPSQAELDARHKGGYAALGAMERHLSGARVPRGRGVHDRRHRALRLHARGARRRLRPRRATRPSPRGWTAWPASPRTCRSPPSTSWKAPLSVSVRRSGYVPRSKRQRDSERSGSAWVDGRRRRRRGSGSGVKRATAGGNGHDGATAQRDGTRESNGRQEERTEAEPRQERRSSGQKDSFGSVLKRTIREFKEDNLTDWAAALTYYGILSDLPGDHRPGLGARADRHVAPPSRCSTTSVRSPPVRPRTSSRARSRTCRRAPARPGSSSSSASPAPSGRRRATWRPSCAPPTRSTTSRRGGRSGRRCRLASARRVVLLVLLAAVAVAVVLTGGLAKQVGGVIGVGDSAVSVWNIAKWPVLILMVASCSPSSTGRRRT